MPNQNNFRSDITTNTDPRFSASRIVRVPTEPVLLEEVASSFAYDKDDVVEAHFYTVPGNQLILSTVITLSDSILKTHTVSYTDGTYKNYLRIDFTKLFIDKSLILIPGDYKLVLNFFSNEIGSYENRKLSITQISPSRTEVELVFNDTIDEVYREENLNLLKEFIEPSFNKADAVGVAEKIFKSGVETERNRDVTVDEELEQEGVTASTIINLIDIPEDDQTYENTISRIERLELTDIFKNSIDDFVVQLYNFIREEIVINGDERIQEDEYREIIRRVVKEKIGNLRQTMDSRIKIS